MSDMFNALEAISRARRYNDWIISHFKPYLSGVVFDVGSGRGDMAALYDLPAVTRIVVSDHSSEMTEFLKQRFALKAPRFDVLPLADISCPERSGVFKDGLPDAVISLNVLEHISNDAAVIREMAWVLKPGGRLLAMVPALPWIHGTLDDLVEHSRRYTRKDLVDKVSSAGLQVEKAFYMNFFGIFSWFLAARVFRKKRFDPSACQALDRIVPLLRFLERFGSPPVGQSLIVVARKN